MVTAGAAMACEPGETGLPVLDLSFFTWGLNHNETATLLVVPDGNGAPLTAARRPGGAPVDATMRLTLLDACYDPIAHYPQEDLWLESVDQGLVLCAGGSIADHDTDLLGQTVWTQALRAGGHSLAGCRVVVSGTPGHALPLRVNSPDLNGDLVVSLIDIAMFASAFYGPYTFAADLWADGAVNISDIPVLAEALGAGCP
jgi:hypothetical protein